MAGFRRKTGSKAARFLTGKLEKFSRGIKIRLGGELDVEAVLAEVARQGGF
ncbi:hypothetical protein C1H46_041108 [Malus baccata]|uniref:Uncharacterized protein n=1 Tax=Malus baccata TaxID=106549 RepID=A0A540KH73_MALBA|nr:hypothetical protein C1H46_041108 [Malus baccata]